MKTEGRPEKCSIKEGGAGVCPRAGIDGQMDK